MTGISPTRVIGGRYVVLGELAPGRAGPVWRAQDRVTGRQVTVKELHLPAGQGAEERLLFRDRLLRAARAAGRADAPGIVTVHDVVTDDGVDHVVTELVEAPTLAEEVAAAGPLDERAAAAVAGQLAAALQAVHEAGVVHGGVTPGAVLLGPGPLARLADLGVSEAAADGAAAAEPGFVAPELRDGGAPTAESDVWALGATLFHALHGRPPGADGTRPDDGPLGPLLRGMLHRAPRARLTALQVTALLESEVPSPSRAGAARRWWLAVAAVLGVLAGGAGGFALAGAGAPDVRTLTHGPGGDVPLPAVPDGGCLRGPLGGPALVGCAEPHDLEVVATLDPGGSVGDPGRTDRFAATTCTAAVEALVAQRDGLEVVALVPVQDGAAGPVHCLVRQADGAPLVGSRISGEGG
ncbi:protein kinase domain-containing protein [Pseudonocardia sichuanensis]